MGEAAVVVPVIIEHAFKACGQRQVLVVAKGLGEVAVGVKLRVFIGFAVKIRAGGMALVISTERVGLAVANRQFRVEPHVHIPRQTIAHGEVALAGCVSETVITGTVGRIAVLVLGAHADKPAVFTQAGADLGRSLATLAVCDALADGVFTGVINAIRGGHFAAFRGVIENDVDHPGNRVGTVLGARAVAQHFNAFDGADRDRVEVHRCSTATDLR